MVNYKNRSYYNKEQKIEYLDYLSTNYLEESVVSVSFFLSKFRQFEEDYEMDLCDFSLSCAKVSFAMVSGRSPTINRRNLTYIQQYVAWCVANGRCKYGVENKWNLVRVKDINLSYIINIQMPKNPEVLQEKLDQVYRTTKDETLESEMAWFYKTALYLVYLGFDEEEIPLIKCSEVDLVNKRIVTKNKTIYFDDYLYEYIETLLTITSVTVPLAHGLAKKKLIESEYLIKKTTCGRPSSSNIVSLIWLRWNCDNFNKQYQKQTDEAIGYTLSRLYDAGVFYKVYQRELSGEVISLDTFPEYYPKIKNHIQFYNKINEYKAWRKVYHE